MYQIGVMTVMAWCYAEVRATRPPIHARAPPCPVLTQPVMSRSSGTATTSSTPSTPRSVPISLRLRYAIHDTDIVYGATQWVPKPLNFLRYSGMALRARSPTCGADMAYGSDVQ
eukprot:1235712-Rhodomonas_salina.1